MLNIEQLYRENRNLAKKAQSRQKTFAQKGYYNQAYENLQNAFEKLNGLRLPLGDVGYQIDAFSCEPMQFYFWDCDDEFEAQANILFDYSATDFNHVESAVSTAEMGVRRLAELAGLPLKGKTFEMS